MVTLGTPPQASASVGDQPLAGEGFAVYRVGATFHAERRGADSHNESYPPASLPRTEPPASVHRSLLLEEEERTTSSC